MNTFSDSSSNDARPATDAGQPAVYYEAPPPPPLGTYEQDAYARQVRVPGHLQEALHNARIGLVGGGGIGGWAGMGLARSGTRTLTVFDPDLVERTNLSRQLFFISDLEKAKAVQLCANLVPHMTAGGSLTGVALPFEQAMEQLALPLDLLVVGVDNNACRLAAVREARKRGLAAVFIMLSADGMRCQAFLQGPHPADACLWCALPNLDEERAMPCAAAVISSCFLAAALAVFFAHRALMGWPEGVEPYNWRDADLLAVAPDVVGRVRQRQDCRVCREFRS